MLAVFLALLFVFGIYITFAYLALNIYGDAIQVSIFNNFEKESDILTFGVSFLFFIVFISVIPFCFYPGKLCVLNIL